MSVIYRNGTYYGQESSGSGSGGHTILDAEGTSLNQREKLKFVGMEVTDDSENDTTVVEIPEMTEEDIQDIKDAFTPNIGAPLRMMNYSTDEQVVGTWIDGKPIYQKTVEFTTPSAASDQPFSYLPTIPFTDMDILIKVEGRVNRSDGWFVPCGLVIDNYTKFYFDWNKNIQRIYFGLGTLTVNQQSYLTFYYTKTTD